VFSFQYIPVFDNHIYVKKSILPRISVNEFLRKTIFVNQWFFL